MLAAIAFLSVAAKPVIALELKTPKTTYKAGEEMAFTVSALNCAPGPISLVPALDGSDRRRRGPWATFMVKTSFADWHRLVYHVGYCGNTDPIEANCFHDVAAGKRLPIAVLPGPISYTELAKAGDYQIKFVYDTTVPFDQWIGGPLQEVAHRERISSLQSRFDQVPKGKFESNVIRVRVRA